MQSNANAEADRTPEVEPAIKPTAPWRVTAVSALPDARLRVTFVDGTSGEVEMGAFLRSAGLDGTVFEALRDPALFARRKSWLGRFNGPMEPTSRRMRCTTPSAHGAFGFSIE